MVIPELTELLKTRPAAIGALAHLGSPGFPPLLTAWSNSTDRNERWQIEYAVLQNLTPNDRNTNLVPLLLSIRNKASQSLWISASNALSQIAPDLPTNSSAR